MKHLTLSLLFVSLLLCVSDSLYPQTYNWLDEYNKSDAIANHIPTPDGYERIKTATGTFEDWLRYLPLKKGKPPVRLYDGSKKSNQSAHYAVLDIDVGNKDLQQCADAVIRLRAEYLYSKGDYTKIHFNFTNGDKSEFAKWADGYRPVVNGNKVKWIKSGIPDFSYQNFRKYLDSVFMYAGSYSLSKELKRVQSLGDMNIGDVFIEGGFPGHAVIVVDMAVNQTGKTVFLLAQSYMPAQEIHILNNPKDSELNPWYDLNFGEILYTPEWSFGKDTLRRF
jgi:hypothetical protein